MKLIEQDTKLLPSPSAAAVYVTFELAETINESVPSPLSFVNCGNTFAFPAVSCVPSLADCVILNERIALKSALDKSDFVNVSLSIAPI